MSILENCFLNTVLSTLTGDIYLDEKIFHYLDIVDVLSISEIDTYTNSLCRDDIFWKRKIRDDMSPILVEYKPAHESYREQYIYLHNEDIQKSIEDCRLDGVIYHSDSIGSENIMDIFYEFPDHMIDVLISLSIIEFTKKNADGAAMCGHINILKTFIQHGVTPSVHGNDMAARNGHLDVLKLLARDGLYLSLGCLNWIAFYGHVDILEFLV